MMRRMPDETRFAIVFTADAEVTHAPTPPADADQAEGTDTEENH